MSTVNHQQAQRLAALGYPQDRFPQIVWTANRFSENYLYGWATGSFPGPNGGLLQQRVRLSDGAIMPKWYAAPVYVSGDGQSGVFDWLEHKYGVQWSRNRPSLWRSDKDEWVVVIWQDGKLDGHAEKVIGRDTASDVLDAILDQLEAAQLTAKEAP